MKREDLKRRIRRKKRIRSVVHGTKDRPKISVFRSNRYFYAQAIDDEKRQTLFAFSSISLRKKQKNSVKKKSEEAKLVGSEMAKKLLKMGIKKGILDRGSYAYSGRVKMFVEGAREGGLEI